jgi:hypothetical protein
VLPYRVVRLTKMVEDTLNFGKVRSFAYGTGNLRICVMYKGSGGMNLQQKLQHESERDVLVRALTPKVQ